MTWQKQSIGNIHIPLVNYGGNSFLGVGKKNVAHISNGTGLNWKQYVIDSSANWSGFLHLGVKSAFGNGTWFVFVSASPSNYYTSTNSGKNWTSHSNSSGYKFGEVVYAKSKFIAIEHLGNQCVTSTDGVHWQPQNFPSGMTLAGAEPRQIVKGLNNIVVSRFPHVSGSSPTKTWFAISSDGINWSQSGPVPFPCNPWRLAYNDSTNRFVAIVQRLPKVGTKRNLEVIKSDDDGQTWQEIKNVKIPGLTSSTSWNFKFAFGNGRFVLLPSNHTSTKYPTTVDGKSWKTEDLLCKRLDRIQFGNSKFVVTGGNGVLVTGT